MICVNTLQEINIQIEAIKESQLELQSLTRKRDIVTKELESLTFQISKAKIKYSKERLDVEKLESLSFKNFLTSVLGTKREHLTKEQEEMVQAKSILDNLQEQHNDLDSEKDKLDHQINNINADNSILDRLLDDKKKIILSKNPHLQQEIERLDRDTDIKQSLIKELRDVVYQCEATLSTIKIALDNIKSALNWGRVDMFLDGGIFTHMNKHDKIKKANQNINRVRSNLNRLNKELQDISQNRIYLANINTTDIAFDLFFDNIFTDWSIQSKLNDAHSQLNRVYNKVAQLKTDTRRQLRDASDGIDDNTKKAKELIKDY